MSNSWFTFTFIILLVGFVWFVIHIVITDEQTEKREKGLKEKYGKLSPEEIIFHHEIQGDDKLFLLKKIHGCTHNQVVNLCTMGFQELEKEKKRVARRHLNIKAREYLSPLPEEERERKPIPDDVKMFVWQGDKQVLLMYFTKEMAVR